MSEKRKRYKASEARPLQDLLTGDAKVSDEAAETFAMLLLQRYLVTIIEEHEGPLIIDEPTGEEVIANDVMIGAVRRPDGRIELVTADTPAEVKATTGMRMAARGADEHAGRNAPCPCGSGRKYKKCCGK